MEPSAPGSGGVAEVRSLLSGARPEWLAGHGQSAWELLRRARALPAASSAPIEVLATEAALHLLAEQPEEAEAAARAAIELASRRRRLGAAARLALADARVTLASLAAGDEQRAEDSIAVLEEIAADPATAGTTTASRAVNNALLSRLDLLEPHLDTVDGQVRAWLAVGRARALTRDGRDPGTVQRQAVDLALRTGQWERGWDHAHQLLAAGQERNEHVSVLSKAAMLAWHREMLPETRDLGTAARETSVAVDLPWVRTYAYLGGVLAAAAGAGSMAGALRAYSRCTTRAGHESRSGRAWEAAQIALDAGHPPDDVQTFLDATLPDGLRPDHIAARARVLLADASGTEPDEQDMQTALTESGSAADRARVLLVQARRLRRGGRTGAAVAAATRAQQLLRDWPGRVLSAVEHEIALLVPPVPATPAQRRVLDLLADGHSNAAIAIRLGCSKRTVAVHVAALLRVAGARSRTELAAKHLRRGLVSA